MSSQNIDILDQRDPTHRARLQEIIPYMDYIAVSAYPYQVGYDDPPNIPSDYFTRLTALAPDKPVAFAETGFPAEHTEAFGVIAHGTEERQNAYLQPRDIHRYFEAVRALNPDPEVLDLFRWWLSTGLVDRDGRVRQALTAWRDWLGLPARTP